jgi:hypothetical protein
MAIQNWFEFRGGSDNVFFRHMWAQVAHVYRNRWLLTNAKKRAYGFTTAGFKPLIYASAGPGWWDPKTKAGQQSHWNSDGSLKQHHQNDLIRILRSSPDSAECRGMMAAFEETARVYGFVGPASPSQDPSLGATFYVHYWYPYNPFAGPGAAQPNLSNPFNFNTPPYLAYTTPYVPYGERDGVHFFVSVWTYRPAD